MSIKSLIQYPNFGKSRYDFFLTISKIAIIAFTGFFLLTNFIPYYQSWDPFIYALNGIELTKGNYGFTNEFLKETGLWEFVPIEYTKTQHNTAIPIMNVGLPSLVAISYFIAGIYGIFFLSPLFTITYLMLTERITSKLFGSTIGLLTLIFVATNSFVIRIGQELFTDNIFSLFFILGSFFLIRFFQTKQENKLFLASLFFTFTAFLRINGLVLLPVEFILIGAFFIHNHFFKQKKLENIQKSINQPIKSLNRKFILKASLFVIIPWIFFLLFWFSFNNYYFDDPLTNYDNNPNPRKTLEPNPTLFAFFEINELRFENFKGFSQFVLPYPLSGMHEIPQKFDYIFGNNWLGIIPIIILIFSIFVSFKTKSDRVSISVFISMYFALIFFFSSSYIWDREYYVSRYMIPFFPMFFMIISWLIMKLIRHIPKENNFKQKLLLLKSSKIIVVCGLVTFFIVAFYFSEPIQALADGTYSINNPAEFVKRYPLDMEGLSEESIIVNTQGTWTLDYGAIPFNPYWKSCCHVTDTSLFSQESIDILKELLKKEHDVYIFKEPIWPMNKLFFKYLVDEKGIILVDHSDTFCKMVLVEANENNSLKTDDVCI